MYRDYLDVNPEVAKALEEGRPVVALESTIIAHGMPYPKNVETAIAVEEVIKANGAVPATIGILGGRIKIGLTKEEIEYMAHAKNVLKVSRRDLPLVIAQKMDGATTVAGTMIAANMAGIKLFVTGGIGGVHRGAGESFDFRRFGRAEDDRRYGSVRRRKGYSGHSCHHGISGDCWSPCNCLRSRRNPGFLQQKERPLPPYADWILRKKSARWFP